MEQRWVERWAGVSQAMELSHFDGLLLALGLGGQVLLFFVLVKSRLYRTFPIFFSYIAYSSVSDIALLLLLPRVSVSTYRLAFFANNVPEYLLQIGILIEVSHNVFNRVGRSLPRVAIWLYLGMLAVATVAAWLLSMHSPAADLDRWSEYFVHISFAVAILRLAIFSVIAAFSHFLGIGWKNHVLQIATGFLTYSVAILLVVLLHRYTGVGNESLYHLHEQFRIISWCMVLGFWNYALSRSEAPRREFSPRMAEFLVSVAGFSRNYRSLSFRAYRK